MRTRQTIVGLTLAAAVAACGELATNEYQPPPLGTISVELALTAPPAEDVRVLLVWQPAVWTTEPGDVLLQSNPLTTGLAVSCPRPEMSCGGAGSVTCTTGLGLAEQVATLPPGAFAVTALPGSIGTLSTAELEVPIYGLPPADALRDLGDGTRLAVGYLLFLPAGSSEPVANSAFSGPVRGFETDYRTSYLIAYREGDPPAPACDTGCDPGVLARLPAGFSLVLKLEKESATGLLPVYLAHVPLGTRIVVNGHEAGAGGTWCDEIAVEQTWNDYHMDTERWSRCSTTPEGLTCRCPTADGICKAPEVATPCHVRVARRETCGAALPPDACSASEDRPLSVPAPNLAFRRLPWGDVLAVGSAQPDVVAPASLYDVAGRSWRPTGSPAFPRSAAAVTVLTSGKVLVTGGASDDDTSRSAELYDPATGAWTPALSMRTPRSGHTATLLRDGRVLVLGGESEVHPEGAWDAEVFDPVEGTWLPFDLGMAGPALVDHTAVLLAGDDSPVLVTGANGGPAAFICVAGAVPPAKACRPTASMNVAHPGGTFTLLADGKVLAVGGRVDATSAEVFDPAPGSETWTPVTPMPRGRVDHAAVLLPSGRVLVAGGEALDGGVVPYTATADLYEPVADAWEPAPSLLWERGAFAMFAALADPGEEVLVVGGPRSTRGYLAPVEVVCLPPAPGARGARPAERARGPR